MTNYFHVCCSAYYSTFSCCFQSFLLARVVVTALLPYEPINPTGYSHHIQPNHAYKTQSVACLYSGPASMSMQLHAAAVTSQPATTSDNLLPASTLDMSPPLLSVVTLIQSIQPMYCTTLLLQNSPVIAHSQQLSFVQQIPVPTSQALHYHCFQLPAIHKIFHYHLFLL